MATPIWQGGALATADLWTLSFGGTLEVGDLYLVTIGSKTYTYTGTSTSVATEATAFVAAWNALSLTYYPEFREYTAAVTSGGNLTLTHNTLGVSGTISVSTTESNGAASDGQTFTATHTTSASGPNFWTTAANWSTGTAPVAGDDVRIENSSVSILYDIDQAGITLASLYVAKSFTGRIGLAKHNGSYYEYRPQYLAISATVLQIGQGEGQGSGRIKIDTGSAVTTYTNYGSGAGIEANIPPVLWKGAHGSNVVEILKGHVGLAYFFGETSTIATLLVGQDGGAAGDTKVVGGTGLTYTTLEQAGGTINVETGATTMTRNGGEMSQRGGNVTTLNNWSGTWAYTGTGTVTTYNGGPLGKADFSRDGSGRAVTTANLYKGTEFYDPRGTVTFGSGASEKIRLIGCKVGDVKLDLGYNRVLLPS